MNTAVNRSVAANHRIILSAYRDETLRPHVRKLIVTAATERLNHLRAFFSTATPRHARRGKLSWT